jgi:hypothetical protein
MGFLLPLGIALSAAGAGYSVYSSIQAANEQEDIIKRQIAQQEEYQKQATPLFEESVSGSGADKVAAAKNAAKASAAEAYRRATQMPVSTSTARNTLSPVNQGRLDAETEQAIGASAELQGFQSALSDQGLNNAEVARQLGVISNLSASSAQTTPYLTNLAAMNGAQGQAIGSAFTTLGGLTGMYGALNRAASANPGAVAPQKPGSTFH